MERSDLYALLKEAGMPVTYRKWAPAEPPDMPYIVFFQTGRNDVYADDSNYVKVRSWCAELYSKKKHDEGEEAVESALSGGGIAYKMTEIGDREDYFLAAYYFDTV